MSTQTEEFDPIEGEDQLPEGARQTLRRLQREAKDFGSTKAELDRYKLKDTLRENSIDLDNDQITALLAVHGEGEKTPEALRATAERLKFVAPTESTQKTDVDAQKQFDAAQQGAGGQTKQASYEEAIEGAQSMDEIYKIQKEYGKQ